MDKRERMALGILTTLIMEPAPPEGCDWVVNSLTPHLPPEAPHRLRLVHASVILADSLLECLNSPPALPDDWPVADDDTSTIAPLDIDSDLSEVPEVVVGTLDDTE